MLPLHHIRVISQDLAIYQIIIEQELRKAELLLSHQAAGSISAMNKPRLQSTVPILRVCPPLLCVQFKPIRLLLRLSDVQIPKPVQANNVIGLALKNNTGLDLARLSQQTPCANTVH